MPFIGKSVGTAGIDDNADATAITITNDEKVGIGTAVPASLLELEGADPIITLDDTSAGGYAQVQALNGSLILMADEGGSVNNSIVRFDVDGSERMRIDSSGNVGIGTTSPGSLGTGFNNQFVVSTVNSSGFANITAQGAAGSGGGIDFHGGSIRHAGIYSLNGSNLAFYTNGSNSGTGLSERIRIASDGKVGIAVNSPAATLDVNGTIKLDGNYPVGTGNVALGDTALDSITSDGINNVAIGRAALTACTTGDENTAVGRQALEDNTTGNYNTALGALALFQNSTASYNTSVGRANLYNSTTGDANTSTGYYGMYTNTTGTYNTSDGTSSLQYNTTGSYNVGIGSSALLNNTTGTYNTGVGYQSLLTQTTATHNVGLGFAAGYDITTGSGNVSVGNYAGFNHTTGSYSTYVGYQAGYTTTTGLYNTYLGGFSGYNGSTANYSTCVGYYSGFGLTTNGYHAMLGYYAGSNSTGGAYGNTCVGYNAQAGASGSERHTSIVLGYNTMGVGSGYFCFGTGTGNSRVYNQFGANASWTRVSDQRYKTDIQDNTNCGLAFINDLRSVTFKWKPKSEIDNTLPDYDADATEAEYSPKMYGLIAQEVKQVLDNHNITDFGGWHKDEDSSIEGISQEMFIYPLIKAVQELSAKVTALENGG